MYDMMMMIEESRVEMKADDHDYHNIPENMVNWVSTRNKKELEEIKVWKNFLKQHPWSVSDPGLLSSILPEEHHTPREYLSSPLLKGGFQGDDKHPLLNKGDFLQINLGEEKNGILKIVGSKTLLNKNFLKWMFILLNIFAEICQATFGQEKSEGKMGRQKYLKLSIITSSVCLTMAIFEALHERNINGMVWQKRGYCCWFYYPGNQGKLFGKFSIYFGIISSLIQLIINLIEKITRNDIVKFEYMSLLLSIFYLLAAIIGSKDKKSLENVSIRCNVHGLSEIKGIIVEGCENKVFQCPHCELEDSNV